MLLCAKLNCFHAPLGTVLHVVDCGIRSFTLTCPSPTHKHKEKGGRENTIQASGHGKHHPKYNKINEIHGKTKQQEKHE